MKKSIIYLVVALTLLSSSLTLVPNVLAQQENIKVLNYSYQIDNSHNILIVYGEVQNVGSSTLMDVVLGGSVYSGGTDQADATGQPYAIYIVPQQKVPFEIDFNAPNSSPDGTWDSVSISNIEFTTTQANVTSSYPYPDVKITSQSSSIDTTSAAKGTYWINGNIQNTGSQAAQNIYVVATFYNSSGDTVSAGWSSMIDTLNPKATTSFEVGAFDINMSEITPQQKISSYSLIVRPGDPTLTGNAPDPSAYGIIADSSSSQSSSSSSPTPTGSSTGNNTAGSSNEWLIYAAIIIIIAVAVVITIKTFPKHKSAESTKTKNSPKVTSKKPQGKVQFSSVSLFKYFLRNWVCL